MGRMKLEEELEKWADLAEADPDLVLDETADIDVTLNLKRRHLQLEFAPYLVKTLEERAKVEGKSIDRIVERWITEKLFIEKL